MADLIGAFPFPKFFLTNESKYINPHPIDVGGNLLGCTVNPMNHIGGVCYVLRKKFTKFKRVGAPRSKTHGWSGWQKTMVVKYNLQIIYAYPLIPIIHLPWFRRDMETQLYREYNTWSNFHRRKNPKKQATMIYESNRLELVNTGGNIFIGDQN